MRFDSIIIGFSTNKHSILSRIICKIEGTPYSHVYVRFYSESIGRWLVYHAALNSVHFDNHPSFLSKNHVIEEFELKTQYDCKVEALQLCVDRVGTPYGKAQLVGMGLVRLVKSVFNVKISNPWTGGQVCSELVARILNVLQAPIDMSLIEYEGPRYIHQVVEQMVKVGTATKI
jgi:hypothetical protein